MGGSFTITAEGLERSFVGILFEESLSLSSDGREVRLQETKSTDNLGPGRRLNRRTHTPKPRTRRPLDFLSRGLRTEFRRAKVGRQSHTSVVRHALGGLQAKVLETVPARRPLALLQPAQLLTQARGRPRTEARPKKGTGGLPLREESTTNTTQIKRTGSLPPLDAATRARSIGWPLN